MRSLSLPLRKLTELDTLLIVMQMIALGTLLVERSLMEELLWY
jgi:hypothetical protein